MLLASWNVYTIRKRFRSLNAKNLGFVGQRAGKLLAVKVKVLKKKSAALAIPAEVSHSARVWERPGSNHYQSLTAGNFEALCPVKVTSLS